MMKILILPMSIMTFLLSGCSSNIFYPIYDLNTFFRRYSFEYKAPILAREFLITLADYNGSVRIQLFNLKLKKIVSLPGVNIKNAIPISASISANGNRIAFIRKENQDNKLFILDRKKGSLRRLNVGSEAIPVKVSLSGSGKILAVQIFKNNQFDMEIMRIDI